MLAEKNTKSIAVHRLDLNGDKQLAIYICQFSFLFFFIYLVKKGHIFKKIFSFHP